MTPDASTSQVQDRVNDKELNFRALEQKYQRQLDQERQARMDAERQAQEMQARMSAPQEDDDEDESEPYVNKKKLKKEQDRFGQKIKQETQNEIQKAVHSAIQKERTENWLKQNSDFDSVMENAQKFYDHDPELAEDILKMPNTFERQKIVYKTIKQLGLHKEKVKEPSVQDKIDANRRGPFYQPSNVGTSPYSAQSDFSKHGQKEAYDKMQQMKARLRLG